VSPKAQATRLPVVGLRTEGPVQMVFHDLPGLLDPGYLLQERMREAALEVIERADVILHLHEAAAAPAPDFARLAGLPKAPRAPVLTVYTKSDTGGQGSGMGEGQVYPVSSTTGEGIPRLLEAIAPLLPEREFEYDPEDLGVQPLRFFVVEYLREAAFDLLSDELPYSFTAEVDEFREGSDPVYIRATLYVERNSQKGILIGENGRTIKAIGKHARSRLEQLMGSRVYLETWVKVLPRWRRDPAMLEKFGFVSRDS